MDDVTYSEAVEAYERFRTFTRSPYNANTRMRFEEFLELPVFSKLWQAQWEWDSANDNRPVIPEAAAKKIRWLNGPHGYALYKAWKAQHENQ